MNRESLLGLAGRKYKTVSVRGREFRLQQLSEAEHSSYQALIVDESGQLRPGAQAAVKRFLLVRALVDADGKRLFSDDEHDLLGDLPTDVASPLYLAACELLGVEGDAEKN